MFGVSGAGPSATERQKCWKRLVHLKDMVQISRASRFFCGFEVWGFGSLVPLSHGVLGEELWVQGSGIGVDGVESWGFRIL